MKNFIYILASLTITGLVTLYTACRYWSIDRPPAVIYAMLGLISVILLLKTFLTKQKNRQNPYFKQ